MSYYLYKKRDGSQKVEVSDYDQEEYQVIHQGICKDTDTVSIVTLYGPRFWDNPSGLRHWNLNVNTIFLLDETRI